jgi:aspartate kinase
LPLIIQKYGGKALAAPEDILQVARLVHERHKQGTQIVVVVSALADTTDQYVRMAREVNHDPRGRELDVLLSTGERIAIAMLALALNGIESEIAVSLTGAQAGIITDTVHTAARIIEVRPLRVQEALDKHQIPIIAGYQGITTDKNISTLGRGGTDATAVALAVALSAERVEFMKDVDGVSSGDPKLFPVARTLEQLSYSEALEQMGCGAKILQVPAVEMAAEFRVPLAIGNSKTGVAGTIISDKPLARRTLTAVVQTPASVIQCESGEEFEQISASMREHGVIPLLASSGSESLIAFKSSDEPHLLFPKFAFRFDSSCDLVALFGPGVGGAGELADFAQLKLKNYRAQLRAQFATENSLLVLLNRSVSKEFAASAHELCLKLPS